jgi:hypothetical protein
MRNLHQSSCLSAAAQPSPAVKPDAAMADTRSELTVHSTLGGTADLCPGPPAERLPARIRSPLRAINAAQAGAAAPASVGDACVAVAAATIANGFDAELAVDLPLRFRWFELWRALVSVHADEIADRSVGASVTLRPTRPETEHVQPPTVLGLSSTVYASGDVACAVHIKGLDVPLWLFADINLFRFAPWRTTGGNS